MRVERSLPAIALAAACALCLPASAAAVDFESAPSATIELFQTGQASWEWLLIPTDHGSSPARRIREGRPCLACHQGEEAAIGNIAASGQRLEPDPIEGFPGTIELTVAAVVADDQLHLRLSWPAVERSSPAGSSEHAARITTLIADDAVSTAQAATCWASCHSDLKGMSEDTGLGLTKYLPSSRQRMTRTGGGDNIKPAGELADELEKGAFLEYWTAYLDKDAGVSVKDGYFLEARIKHDEPAVSAAARRDGNRWVVEMQRPLSPEAGPRKTLQIGQRYPLSFAIHESHTSGRRHHVSFPLALVVDADGVRVEEVLE